MQQAQTTVTRHWLRTHHAVNVVSRFWLAPWLAADDPGRVSQ
jgi:hypothetical protein